jgi:hypothetical protein
MELQTHMTAPRVPDFEFDINGDIFRYRENPKLKAKHTVLPYTKEHVDEMVKCANDVKYFANNYFKIVHPQHGLIQMKLRGYQEKCVDTFTEERFSILKFPRQSGKSTVFVAFVCHYILFNEFKNVAIMANKHTQAKELLNRIKVGYQNLPYWLQQGVASWSKTRIELENGCVVQASATSSDAIRGESVSLLIVDECSHVEPTLWDEFWESIYPTITASDDSKVIIVSTPKGMNHYYKLWSQAKKGKNQFVPLEIAWNEVPIGLDDSIFRDEVFKEETIRNVGRRKWNQEFEGNFLAASDSLVDVTIIETLEFLDGLPLTALPGLCDAVSRIDTKLVDMIKIFKLPEMNHVYFCGVDPAKITEESSGDSLAIQMIDTTDLPYEQVMTIDIPSEIHYLEIPELLELVGKFYNEAWMLIENNDAVGHQVADTMLLDYEYENIYSEKPEISGFRTTKKNKKIGCLNLKMLIERNQLLIHDFDSITQLSTFVKHKTSYAAEPGNKDDLVMALIHSLAFMQDRIYFENKMELVNQMLGKETPRELRKEYEPKDGDEPMPFGSSVETDLESMTVF